MKRTSYMKSFFIIHKQKWPSLGIYTNKIEFNIICLGVCLKKLRKVENAEKSWKCLYVENTVF